MQTLEQAQETNARLNRRLQALEGPWQAQVASLQITVDYLRKSRNFEFDRLLKAHAELRECFVAAAEITGAPHKSFHSVMDGCPGWGGNRDHVFANVYVSSGVETTRVVDEVKRALAGQRRPTLWQRLFGGLGQSGDSAKEEK